MLRLLTGENAAKGFSLTEVLIAFAILSVTLITLYQAIAASNRRTATIQERQEALYIAQSIVARVGLDIPLEPSAHSDETGEYIWRLEIEPHLSSDEEDPDTVLYWVTVRVHPQRRPELERARLSTVRLSLQ